MKILIYSFALSFILFLSTTKCSFAQQGTSNNTNRVLTAKELGITHWWLVGGMGAGAVISTDIVNSGGVLPFYLEVMAQQKRNRIGFGMSHEVYLTVKNLAKVVGSLGKKSYNVEKVYLTFEKMLIPNFPVNIGAAVQLGGFLTQDELYENQSTTNTNDPNTISKKNEAHPFGAVGLVTEFGVKPFFLFVKPMFEYKSYSLGHKELIAYVNFGVRLKFDAK